MVAGLAALALAAAGAGCRRAEEAPAAPAAAAAVESASATATVPDDPTKDGWETEAASERIGAQLTVLKAWLTSDERTLDKAAAFLDQNCEGRTRPGQEAEARYSDGVFEVLSSAADRPGTLFRGLEAAAGTMGSLRRGREAHAAAKVTGIRAIAGGWETDVKLQVDELWNNGRRQLNTTCRMVWSQTDPPLLTRVEFGAWEEVTAARAFSDCTEALFAGNVSWKEHLALGTDHWTARIESSLGMDVNGQNGVTLGDINGDGLDDVYLTQQGGLPNRMFLRQADGSLKDVTTESGTGWLDDGHAALLVDLDNDGDQDLVSGMRDGVLIQENDGAGKFTVKAAKLTPTGPPYGLSAADYDQDGDMDIFAACYYQRRTVAKNYTLARPVPYYDAENGAQDVLLRNDGGWRFTDAAKACGIVESKFSYAPSWEDYDDDGDMDLYVANDFGSNRLWRNDRTPEGTVMFTEVSVPAGVPDTAAGMSSAWGDADNDGRMDLYVGNMFSSAGNRIAFQEKFQSTASAGERQLFQRHARGNSLFRNAGGGTFADISEAAGVTLGRWAWSSRFGDLNNDGLLDLYVANGYITQEDPHDL